MQRNGDIDLHIQLSQVMFIQFKQAEKISFYRGWSGDDERLFPSVIDVLSLGRKSATIYTNM